jgi:hypothetical protein
MSKPVRVILGIVSVAIVLCLAQLATRDCRLAPYVYDNCLWHMVRTRFGLPDNRFLRMGLLESVGIILVLILYLTYRFVFPPDARSSTSTPTGPSASVAPKE